MTSRPVTILNVDDTEVARYTKQRALRHGGFEVVDAGTVAEALRQMELLRPELVLLDVKLPDGNGIELCKVIKARWPGTLVLQTSATFVSTEDRTRGLEGGADAYLIQPIEPAELVASVRALMRLHAAEARTRELNETLEQRIDERTRDLHASNLALREQIAQRERAETALVQSQKMEAVGQLTSSMAHDFNNILASMVGYIHLAQRRLGPSDAGPLLEKAVAAAARGRRLTSRLLAFSRSDKLTTELVDMRTLVDGMAEWLQQTAGSRIEVAVTLPPDGDLFALTDANQVELAILNLIINARDAMPQGGRIGIDVTRSSVPEPGDEGLAPGDYVVLSVSDTGVGMPQEVAAHAFEPFFTTKPSGRGTGLGLAQVMGVAKLSQGTARIRSTEGVGTCMSIWLRAGERQEADAGAPVPDTAVHPDDAMAGLRVLLVDDEADIRHTVSSLLVDGGALVDCAANGREALALLQAAAAAPDILLIDYAMPGQNGVEVALQMRQTHPSLAVLFLSGHADHATVADAVAGARLLRKPFRADELVTQMRLLVRGG